jgi:23S rRNA (cytidine2498-2'-O)-methyltransferase
MHAFLAAEGCSTFLVDEFQRMGMSAQVAENSPLIWTETLPSPALLAFARQTLPEAQTLNAASINGWADAMIEALLTKLGDDDPWHLHLWPAYGEGRAGLHRCGLIREAFVERLKKRRRVRLRHEQPTLSRACALLQVMLTAPDAGCVSLASDAQRQDLRAVLSDFQAGEIPHAEDKAAPSRAFAKVVEAELRLDRRIQRGQSCVDLGASPGSWSYVGLQRGARVIAVDRSPLREDLMRHPKLLFHQGDAFKFKPEQTVDWLICDIIAAPQRSIDLLLEWLTEERMRAFIVTIKFKGNDEYSLLDQLKQQCPPRCTDFRLSRLCANKNEVTAFGVALNQ